MAEEMDNIHDFEAPKTAKVLPLGWQILFWGLIAFGVYYTIAYTPVFSGWSQEKAYSETQKQ